MATLIANDGKPCIEVNDVEGVRIAGILLEAGHVKSDALLRWGSQKYVGNSLNPGIMSDVFARVGGRNDAEAHPVMTEAMIIINSDNVIIDNTWLWRADHDQNGRIHNGNNPV